MDGLWSDGEVDAFDVYYNIALVTACVEKPVSTAVLQSINVINSEPIPVLSRCSTLRNIHFGDTVVALGRACDERASLLASFGKFSSGHCGFDRNELLWSTCQTYQIQLGGPVINEDGEVIGVQCRSGSILPVNIISRCLGRLMINEKVNHPHLGMQVTSLHKATLRTLKDMRMKFLDTSAGVIVDEVEEGSSAYQAEIRPLDIIVQCDEIIVTSALMLFELFWDKTRGSLELVVKRASVGDTINLFIVVAEAIPDYLNRLSIDAKVSVPRNAFSSKAEKRSPFPDLVNGGLEYARKHHLDKIDESIVSVTSFKGEERLFGCSGIIFDCLVHDDLHVASIISSASLLGRSFEDNYLVSDVTMVKVTLFDGKTFVADVSSFDLHYNIAILVIKSNDQLAAIDLKSSRSKHRVGEVVLSLGRSFWSNKMIASPGILSNERCDLDCLELCRASCRNPKVYSLLTTCIGGPLINVDGEVLGINFCYVGYTPFLPVEVRSPAHIAGILPNDLIVQCGEEVIGCSMQFLEIMLNKAGEDVEMMVIRASEDAPLSLTLHVADGSPHGVNRWPIPSPRVRMRRQV